MRRALTAVLAATALLASPIARAGDGVYERDAVDLSPPPGVNITRVRVDNRIGNVSVRGHDGDGITVHAIKRAADDATLERLRVSLVPDPAGPVTVQTSVTLGRDSAPIPAGSISIDLVVFVPRSARVEAQVWKGKVDVVGVDNGAALSSNEGDIAVKQVSGDVSTESAHGHQELAEILGAVDARGLEGNLEMADISGDRLAARVHRGQVSGREIRVRELSIRTTNGDIDLESVLVAGGRYRVSAYDGHVAVRFSLGRSDSVRVVASAVDGAAHLAQRLKPVVRDDGAVVGSYGRGSAPAEIELRSRTGNVTVANF